MLERVDRVTHFTAFNIRATLEISESTRAEKAERLLAMAEKSCLITNSLIADSNLETEVKVVGLAA